MYRAEAEALPELQEVNNGAVALIPRGPTALATARVGKSGRERHPARMQESAIDPGPTHLNCYMKA